MMQLSEADTYYAGKTVMLRRVLPCDASLIYSWMQEPFFQQYRPYLKNICSTESLLAQRIQIQTSYEPPFELEAIVLHHPSGIPIGMASLSCLDNINLRAELSVAFKRGIGTKCIAETLFFVFHESFYSLTLNKLYFYVTADNKRMLHLANRYNILPEGRLCKEILSEKGEWTDIFRFCILRQDWQNSILYKKLHHIMSHLK